ncbi:MAG TPA: NifB/NifX family molybdenum-iron cluster-binding protein [Acidimicrobiales bacterium]|nr:MAG: hypothetical protein B7Z69_01045 [Actinobacteria bacterium 21-73-9]HQU26083.1 NifB/NifX family molybdenum-iron cluster-binding protein [Acidimicrobiales bacterium]
MIVCVPVLPDGTVDPRWGRADRLAVADVEDGRVRSWEEHQVDWSVRHDEGSAARHHARVARFLLDHHVHDVVAHHVGEGMVRQLGIMKVVLHLGAEGDARAAVVRALASDTAPPGRPALLEGPADSDSTGVGPATPPTA